MRDFYKLEIWNLGYELTLDFYKLTENFPLDEKNNLTSQIRRASSSIPLNIAEGSSRFTNKAYLQFLNYAYGSCRELEVLLLLSKDLNYIEIEKIDKLSKKLYKFINRVSENNIYNYGLLYLLLNKIF